MRVPRRLVEQQAVSICLQFIIAFFVLPIGAIAADPKEVGWVGLFVPEMIEWSGTERDTARHWEFPLYRRPDVHSQPDGKIVVEVLPHQMLWQAYYLGPGKNFENKVAFQPDQFLEDWGYGPWFHQTFLERRGDWFLLPRDPLPEPMWIFLPERFEAKALHIEQNVPYELAGEDILVTAFGPTQVAIRAACERPDGEIGMVPCPESKEQKLSLRELFGQRGHLLLDRVAKKGC